MNSDAIFTSGVRLGKASNTKAMMKTLGEVALWKMTTHPGHPMTIHIIY